MKPARPASYHHGDLRAALLQAALASGGLQGISLRQLAVSLGVSPAAVYRHFDGKEALLDELAAMGFERLRGLFERAFPLGEPPLDAHDARRRVVRLGRAYLDFARDESALWKLMFSSSARTWRAQHTRDASAARPSTQDHLHAMLLGLHRTGLVPRAPDDDDALVAWGIVHGVASLRDGAVPLAKRSSTALAELLADRVIASLRGG